MKLKLQASVFSLVAALGMVALGAGIFAPGCAHPGPVITDLGTCMQQKVDFSGIIAEVAQDLAEADYHDLLVTLAGRVGWPAVDCAIAEVLHVLQDRNAVTGRDAIRAQRASAFQSWRKGGGR